MRKLFIVLIMGLTALVGDDLHREIEACAAKHADYIIPAYENLEHDPEILAIEMGRFIADDCNDVRNEFVDLVLGFTQSRSWSYEDQVEAELWLYNKLYMAAIALRQ